MPPSTMSVAAAFSCTTPALRSMRTIALPPGFRASSPVAKLSP
jgi:hypothetical protein